ncbi:DUF2252 family protein [Amphritea balenae]|uniref:DUF2252 domain-containing protein n=1 Tax=Amphritea balenae TaxID=452629 RepID=A0A3P1SST9_9GAMM|nr:DUF2252 family protein [Amphritea balenae]RRC99944.1 DUF2252 domain-containing protein [Amphritea balenae]GGK75315.1 hypothetical protein GCM10007941_26760 [Amphritea balenae]
MSLRTEQLQQTMIRVDGHAPGSGLAKHKKMATSPFVMLRGAAAVFYEDLAQGRIQLPEALNSWPLTSVMGDCHISNFGLFSEEGSHSTQVIFAPNDFDDACIGHAGWDLIRFGISLLLSADHCRGAIDGRYTTVEPFEKTKSVSNKQTLMALQQFFISYNQCCENLFYKRIDYHQVLNSFKPDHILFKPYNKALSRTASGESFALKSSLAKAIDLRSSTLRFRDLPDRFSRLPAAEFEAIKETFSPYVDDDIIDIVARQGAGTGSNNMQRYYLLVGPQSNTSGASSMENWPLHHIVEVKKQRNAAPLYHFSELSPVNQLNPAHLTVVCQRRMQRHPDLVLDEVFWRDAHWLVRSRHHAKVGIDPATVAAGKRARNGGFIEYAAACGEALALAHARGDRRSNRFEQAVINSLTDVQAELIQTITDYAGQVQQDWQWLSKIES